MRFIQLDTKACPLQGIYAKNSSIKTCKKKNIFCEKMFIFGNDLALCGKKDIEEIPYNIKNKTKENDENAKI